MDILILVLLSLAGVLLLVLELFLIPGMGIAGIAGGACLVGAVVYAFVVLAATGVAVYAFCKSNAIEKMGLDAKIDDTVELAEPGKKISRLQKQAEEMEETAEADKH